MYSGYSMNLRRTRAIARKEYLHILRDPSSLIMALALTGKLSISDVNSDPKTGAYLLKEERCGEGAQIPHAQSTRRRR